MDQKIVVFLYRKDIAKLFFLLIMETAQKCKIQPDAFLLNSFQTDWQLAGEKMYWSKNPGNFPSENYCSWTSEEVVEINCDKSIPQWFISYTDGDGWGIKDVK